MTRFARARGSKSSNERAPENSTPWEVMKEQLMNAKKESEDLKKREEAEKQRIENYEKFLKDHKVQKRKSTWEEFPETASKNIQKKQKQITNKKANSFESLTSNDRAESPETNSISLDSSKKNKKNKKRKNQELVESQTNVSNEQNQEVNTNNKKKKNKPNKSKETLSNFQAINTDSEHKSYETTSSVNPQINSSYNQNQGKAQKKKNNKKLVEGKPPRRKEIDDNSFQIIIHGKEVELVRYDGFPVMKRDAERLEELRKSMVKKGIPKSEVQRTMKLERRRAEKALARVKREVCYNCRKGGHVLSDCPDLKSKIPGVDGADGICFKCGSTEHRQFDCKVQRDKEFRFATCFICKEPGHIARQCPDNPKGLYPNGGSCKLCGDVTHLRKDCPTVNTQKEESSFKLQTLDNSDNLEGIEKQQTQNVASVSSDVIKKPKKIQF